MKLIKDVCIIAGITVLFLLLIEGILRITGTGFPAKFFLEQELKGEKKLINNVKYTIPFFSERLVRTPMPLVMDKIKKENTCRIFIAGESAAMGDPDYSFGTGRILEVILNEQFPGMKFEVINTAITAVNSNVILPIVKECAHHQPDVFIFYMGNNEVIGPYGPTSVFLPFIKSPFLIRSSIAVNSTRIGQLTRSLGQKSGKPEDLPEKWEGMEMYLKHQLGYNDPRLKDVYTVYRENLRQMCKVAVRNNAAVIVCTVASNLRGCAPFGSAHAKPDESPADAFDAEFWFTRGNECLSAGDTDMAYSYFTRSRDFDLLRFRCDSRINDITRNVSGEFDSSRVHLLDFEQEIRSSAEQGIPGYDLFYEHVHLNFRGNYLLAVNLAESVKKALKIAPAVPVPSQERCESRLAYNSFEESEIYRDVLLRYVKAPFIHQMTHEEDIKRLENIIRNVAVSSASLDQLDQGYINALQNSHDWLIRYNHALFQLNHLPDRHDQIIGTLQEISEEIPHLASVFFNLGYVYQLEEDYNRARENYARALKILPAYSQVFEELGKIGIVEDQYSDAEENFKKANISNERIADILAGMALGFARLKKAEKAHKLMTLCLEYNNNNFDANFYLGGYNLKSKNYQQASRCFKQCVALKPQHADSYFFLGKAFEGNRQFREAETNYHKCIEMMPDNGRYHNSRGKVLFLLRQYPAAIQSFSRTIELDPLYHEAYVNLADCYMAVNNPDEALKTLKRLVPEDIEDPAVLHRLALEYTRLNDSRSAAACTALAGKFAQK